MVHSSNRSFYYWENNVCRNVLHQNLTIKIENYAGYCIKLCMKNEKKNKKRKKARKHKKPKFSITEKRKTENVIKHK